MGFGRRVIAGFVCVPLVVIVLYGGLIAALSILGQVLSQFVDLSSASLTSFLNPSVLLGLESPGGSGGVLDAVFGGPGAPGGTVSRYFVFMVSAGVAAIAWFAIRAVWSWGSGPSRQSVNSKGDL